MHLDVLHVLSSDRRRGAETFGYDLHRALADRGLRSDICCLEPATGDRQLPVPALGSTRFSLAGARALRRRAANAGVVIAHGSRTLLACGVALVGLHTPFVYLSIGDPRYWAGSPARRWRTRWLIGRAKAVVAISPSARKVLVAYYHLAGERVSVIPNGRSARLFPLPGGIERSAARHKLGLPESNEVVAVIGALDPEKRMDVAIAATGLLPAIVLAVAGDGPERPALRELAEVVAPGRVHFLGTTEGTAEILAAADVLVLSSDSEGVPGVLIEAGLTGRPVVATDVGWVRDVVRDGETGLLVPRRRPDLLAAAVCEALDRRDELGEAGRAHCLANFEMESIVDRWQQLIERTATASR